MILHCPGSPAQRAPSGVELMLHTLHWRVWRERPYIRYIAIPERLPVWLSAGIPYAHSSHHSFAMSSSSSSRRRLEAFCSSAVTI